MLKETFSKIYDNHINEIYRFVYLRTNQREVAEDLASEIFFKFWQHNKNKKDEYIKSPRAFLYKIARNMLIDFYRKSNQEKRSLSLESFDDSFALPKELVDDGFAQTVELEEKQEKIQKALSKINPLYSDIIIWYYIEGLNSKEIAQIIQKTEGNVRVLIHRALESLKKEIGEEVN